MDIILGNKPNKVLRQRSRPFSMNWLRWLSLQTHLSRFKGQNCQLSNGISYPNGWEALSTNCQEKCKCENNEFTCIKNTCDTNKNTCISDGMTGHCQGAVLVLGVITPALINFDGKMK